VEYGSIPLGELEGQLAGKPAYLRAALQQVDGRWRLRYVEAVVGSRPLGWRAELWSYEGVAFVADDMTGDQLARALDPTDEKTIELQGYEATVASISQPVSWRRNPSLARHDLSPLPWPSVDFELYVQGGGETQVPSGLLIGADCPSFPSFEAAFRAFFFGDYSTMSAQQVPHGLGRVRVVQLEGWLRRVRVAPTRLDVWVGGDAANGTRVELNGATYAAAKTVGRTGKVRLRLPDGLRDDAWLYLSRENRWLDFRTLGPRWRSGGSRPCRGGDRHSQRSRRLERGFQGGRLGVLLPPGDLAYGLAPSRG